MQYVQQGRDANSYEELLSSETRLVQVQGAFDAVRDSIQAPLKIIIHPKTMRGLGSAVGAAVPGALELLIGCAVNPAVFWVSLLGSLALTLWMLTDWAGDGDYEKVEGHGDEVGSKETETLLKRSFFQLIKWLIRELQQKHIADDCEGNIARRTEEASLQGQSGKIEHYVTAEKNVLGTCVRFPSEPSDKHSCALLAKITDLQDDGTLYSLENALQTLFEATSEDKFSNCPTLGVCSPVCHEEAERRIDCIRSVHAIRRTLAQQTFVGFVGLQNAGK